MRPCVVLVCLVSLGCPVEDGSASADDASSASGESTATSAASTGPDSATTTTGATSTASATSTTSGTTDVDTGPADDDSAGDTASCIQHSFDVGNPNWCDTDRDCCPGNKCVPMVGNWNFGTRCRPISRQPSAIGEPCTQEQGPLDGFDDCVAGAVCWAVDPMTGEGTCAALCEGSCKDAMLQCHQFGGEYGTFELCLASCDPLMPDCVEGLMCTESSAGYGCFPEGEWP